LKTNHYELFQELTTMRQWEYLSGVCEWYWTLSRGVERSEQENEEGNTAKMCSSIAWNVEAKASREQRPSHLRESKQEQCTSAPSVNCPNCWECEKEVDQSKAPRRE
jgi:hypothetical protein